jgi:hypothetical protein
LSSAIVIQKSVLFEADRWHGLVGTSSEVCSATEYKINFFCQEFFLATTIISDCNHAPTEQGIIEIECGIYKL